MYTSSWSVHAYSPFIKSLDSELHYNHGSVVSLDTRTLHLRFQNHGHGANCCYKSLHSSGLRCLNLVAGICFSEVKHWCWVMRSGAQTVLKFMELRSGGCTPVKLFLHQTGKHQWRTHIAQLSSSSWSPAPCPIWKQTAIECSSLIWDVVVETDLFKGLGTTISNFLWFGQLIPFDHFISLQPDTSLKFKLDQCCFEITKH